jgi:tRNA(Ile)-lysidine synthase
MIEEQFPGASDAIATTIANLKGNEAVYHSRISEIERKYKKENIIEVAQLVADEVGVETLLFELLRTYGFNATHVHDIVVSIGQSGKRFYSGRCVALLDRGRLILSDEPQGYDSEEYIVDLSENIKSPIDLAVSIIENDGDLSLKADVNKVFFDAEILSCDAVFKLRHWQQGDRLAPFGMKGTKKLSDIFSDAKLSLDDKSRVWLLTRNDEIVWVLGIRSSRHFAVTDTTKRVLQIEILP